VLVVTAGCGWDLLVDIFTHLMRNITACLNRDIKNNLIGNFVAFGVMFVYTFCVRNFTCNGMTLIVRYRDTDRNIDILGSLDGDLLTYLLSQNLAAGLVPMMRSAVWSRTMRRRTPDTTMDIAIGNCGVTNPLVHWVTLSLIVQVVAVLSFLGTFLLKHRLALLVLNFPC